MEVTMHTRYRIALVSLALLALGSVTPPAHAAQEPTMDPAACTAPAAPGTPLVISGKSGVSQSLPFTLDQPAYSVTWSLAGPSDRLTYMSLESTTGTTFSGSTLVNASGGDPVTGGQTAVYKLKPGQYYLAVRAPAGWSVTFTPLPV